MQSWMKTIHNPLSDESKTIWKWALARFMELATSFSDGV
jgi:hypothetical protein